ncbi:hypothetical protein HHI36_001250, partial [Cryptolaemus montrouzieri]
MDPNMSEGAKMATTNHSFLQWNINGYFPHLEMFQILINEYDPSIIGLQETHFKPNKSHSPRNYKGFFKSREN